MGKGDKMVVDPDIGAVVVGFDRNINYYKIQYATLCIREIPGCQFIATNLDAVTHLTDAQEWAGNGAMVRASNNAKWCRNDFTGRADCVPCVRMPA
jgi:phosphoglycolate phosphatase